MLFRSEFTRQSSAFEFGLSPRGGLALLNAAKAYALLDGKKYVLPEHVQTILPTVANHRLPNNLDAHSTYMDVGSVENAGAIFPPTGMDAGNVENAGATFPPKQLKTAAQHIIESVSVT